MSWFVFLVVSACISLNSQRNVAGKLCQDGKVVGQKIGLETKRRDYSFGEMFGNKDGQRGEGNECSTWKFWPCGLMIYLFKQTERSGGMSQSQQWLGTDFLLTPLRIISYSVKSYMNLFFKNFGIQRRCVELLNDVSFCPINRNGVPRWMGTKKPAGPRQENNIFSQMRRTSV